MLNDLWFLLIFPGFSTAVVLYYVHWMKRNRENRFRLPVERFPRPAGWGLQQRTQDIREDFLFDFLMLAFIGTAASLLFVLREDWVSAMALGIVGSAVFFVRIKKRLPDLWTYSLGLQGEQIVGRVLDQLASGNLRVFHDYVVNIPGKKPWNIDHVVVAPDGVYAIETKARRKSRKNNRGWEVTFDGCALQFPTGTNDSAIKQAQGAAEYLQEKLVEWNPCPVPVYPVVVIPGWMIHRTGKGSVSVLNHNELGSFFANRKQVLDADSQRAIAGQINERCQVELS